MSGILLELALFLWVELQYTSVILTLEESDAFSDNKKWWKKKKPVHSLKMKNLKQNKLLEIILQLISILFCPYYGEMNFLAEKLYTI